MKENMILLSNFPHIPDLSKARDYQKECIAKIEEVRAKEIPTKSKIANASFGAHLVVMATGLGKTVCLSHIPRHGRVLLLSHRDELVHQPEKYYINEKVYDKDGNLLPVCTFGVEQAAEKSHGEEVISASVQSLIRRLDKFEPDYFDTIIVDEAHHIMAESYKKIISYFHPKMLLGFTATPDRNDKADLHQIFDDIIYMKDIKWGIQNNYLTDIECYQVNCGYNLDDIKIQMGDFHQPSLAAQMMLPEVMDRTVETYDKLHKGQTLIFAVNVDHAYALQKRIKNSVVVEASTPNRQQIFDDFTNRKIECLINVFIVTEGTDLPLIETVMMVRPTKNLSLITQCVGRGLRLSPGKKYCRLIDCVGTSKRKLATVGAMFGLDEGKVPESQKDRLQGCLITKMEDTIEACMDIPEFWISDKKINMFRDDNHVDLKDINFTPLADDTLVLSLSGFKIIIPSTDALGNTKAIFKRNGYKDAPSPEGSLQDTIDRVYNLLVTKFIDSRALWDLNIIRRTWGGREASPKQIAFIEKLQKITHVDLSGIDLEHISKNQAGSLIDRMIAIQEENRIKHQKIKNNSSKKIRCQTNYAS